MASADKTVTLDSADTLPLLAEIATLGKLTTIVIHNGHVFEFKGEFPGGAMAHGYYNLLAQEGFTGHLKVDSIRRIEMICGRHRGRDTWYWQFLHDDGSVAFKVFLGRDADGNVNADQLDWFLNRFQQLNRSNA